MRFFLLLLIFIVSDCKNNSEDKSPCSPESKTFWAYLISNQYTKSNSSVCNLKLPSSNQTTVNQNPPQQTPTQEASINLAGTSFYRLLFNNNYNSFTANPLSITTSGAPNPVFDAIEKKEGTHSVAFNPGSTAYNAGTRLNLGIISLPNQFSISVWFRAISNGLYSEKLMTLFANKNGPNSQTNGIAIHFNEYNMDNRKILLSIGNGTVATDISTPTNSFNYNTWNHLVITIDRTAGVGKVYINGTEIILSPNNTIRTDFIQNQAVNIGTLQNVSDYLYGYSGNLDDFRLYNFILTATQVTSIFNEVL